MRFLQNVSLQIVYAISIQVEKLKINFPYFRLILLDHTMHIHLGITCTLCICNRYDRLTGIAGGGMVCEAGYINFLPTELHRYLAAMDAEVLGPWSSASWGPLLIIS